MPEMEAIGMKCSVFAPVKGFDPSVFSNKARSTMSQVAQYAVWAAENALEASGLKKEDVQNERCATTIGGSFGGINEVFKTERFVKTKRPTRAGITGLVKGMNSTTSGNTASYFKIRGQAFSLCSSFASGPDSIGHGYELIKHGFHDLVICGSAEEEVWKQVGAYFDNAGALARGSNHSPEEACRPYDRNRRGFVMSAGAGILILESLKRAESRGAEAAAEIVGYGAANDGYDIFRTSGEGLKSAMRQALASARERGDDGIDYINGHATGTTLGDRVEVAAIREVFPGYEPLLSSTKGLAGHGMGATGAQEAVYTLLMLSHGFVSPTRNLVDIDEKCLGVPHVQNLLETDLSSAMTVSLGLGGTASCLIFKKL